MISVAADDISRSMFIGLCSTGTFVFHNWIVKSEGRLDDTDCQFLVPPRAETEAGANRARAVFMPSSVG